MNEKQKADFLKLAEKTLQTGKITNTSQEEITSSNALFNIPVCVTAVLGKAVMPMHELLKMGPDSVVELDKQAGEQIDIYVNNHLIAKGELVNRGEKLCVTMTEIVKP